MMNAAPEPGQSGQEDGQGSGAAAFALEVASYSHVGPVRPRNEDRCGHHLEDETTALVVVADGVSGFPAGDVASQMAVDLTLSAYREQDPGTRLDVRLARAVQQANIGIHDRALVIPELRGMATTVTAVAIARGRMAAAHVGDSRLYVVRRGRALQLTKDHTAGRSVLTRSVGRELIVAIDRLTRPLEQGDVLVICTDGLYNVLQNADLARLAGEAAPGEACRALVDEALARETNDNATAAVIRVVGATPDAEPDRGVAAKLRRLLGRGG
jgi:serine/threonine protein phosphatase PrpC